MTVKQLKIKAQDSEDLAVLAGLLQDSLVPVRDMAFLPEEKRFVMVANRYRWEDDTVRERVNCALTLDGIERVQSLGVDRSRQSDILELLTIMVEERDLVLVFAGGGLIRLECDSISATATDIGEPWPTQWRPDHAND